LTTKKSYKYLLSLGDILNKIKDFIGQANYFAKLFLFSLFLFLLGYVHAGLRIWNSSLITYIIYIILLGRHQIAVTLLLWPQKSKCQRERNNKRNENEWSNKLL